MIAARQSIGGDLGRPEDYAPPGYVCHWRSRHAGNCFVRAVRRLPVAPDGGARVLFDLMLDAEKLVEIHLGAIPTPANNYVKS